MQQEEPALSYAGCDDLESPRAAAVEKALDLVAPMVHVGREGKLPLPPPQPSDTSTTSTTAAVTTLAEPAPTRPLQLLTQHQYVVPQVDQQHHLQVSQIDPLAATKTSITSPIYSTLDGPASENARLTEPFSPVYPLYDSESEGRSLTPIDQFRRSAPTTTTSPQSTLISPNAPNSRPLSPKQIEVDSIAAASPRQKGNMFFGELQKSSAAAHRRRSMATTSALTDYEADLTSKDRMKQKDAIKRLLAGKIRDDWAWTWPREGDEPGTPTINRSQESLIEEDWRECEEWVSNASESEDGISADVSTPTVVDASDSKDPFRFDSPDGVGDTLRRTTQDRKARRRRRLEEEMQVNDGLSCFTHRRNAWTCARHVRLRRRPSSSTHPPPPKRTLSRPPSQPSPTTKAHTSSPPQIQEEDGSPDQLITEVPVAPPILPPDTPMRKGINERAYATIYDKVVLQSQTPFCPVNLAVVTRSCVEGWKRDGEWPPKSSEAGGEVVVATGGGKKTGLGGAVGSMRNQHTMMAAAATTTTATAAMTAQGLGLEREGKSSTGKSVLRRSLQKVMVAVRERAGSKGKEGEVVLPE